jgi:hypothetical protein
VQLDDQLDFSGKRIRASALGCIVPFTLATFGPPGRFSVGYTLKNVKPALLTILLTLTTVGVAQDISFRTVKLPTSKGKLTKAVLTFSDSDKAVEIRPVKGDAVSIPYGDIDKFSYEFTAERTIALTKAKTHWLEVDYHLQDARKVLVLEMQKRDYIRILDAVKAHTGMDVDLEGNAKKR